MYAFVHRALAVAVVLVAATMPALLQEVGLVSGRVIDETGVPLVGAIVQLQSPGMQGTLRSITDLEGRYWFRAVHGNYPLTLRATAAGRVPLEYIGHTARRDGSVTVDFALRVPGDHDILVLIEEGVPYHQVALEGALSAMPGRIATLAVRDRGPETVRELAGMLEAHPSAVLAIGETAARLARRHIKDVPVVFCMVPAPIDSDLTTRNMCGVPLNGGFDVQMAHLRHVAPEARRIATIYEPRRMGSCLKQVKADAQAAGLELVTARAYGDDPQAFERALLQLEQEEIDAFLLLLDPRLIDERNFERVARFAASRNLILAVPDQSLALPGKNFSFVPGFWNLGAYAGGLVRLIVEGKAQPSKIGIVYPDAQALQRSAVRLQRLTPHDVLPAAEGGQMVAALPE